MEQRVLSHNRLFLTGYCNKETLWFFGSTIPFDSFITMSRKRPRTTRTTTGPRSICHWATDDEDGVSGASFASSRQQSTLHSFFVTGSPTLTTVQRKKLQLSQNRTNSATPSLSKTPVAPITPPTVSPLSHSNPTVSTSPLPLKKKQLKQVYLDCGQSAFGQQLCELCGMLYMPGVEEDTKAHAMICQERCLGVVWRHVRGQRTHHGQDQGNGIVSFWQKSNVLSASLESVYSQVAQDLGMEATISSQLVGHTLWLYLRNQRVIGFVATKPISNAFSLVTCSNDETTNDNHLQNHQTTGNLADGDPLSNNTHRVMTKAILGIAIMWTHSKFRNQGIATALIDAARQYAFFGMTVPTSQVAFSSPTTAGWNFAKKYCEIPLIYEYCDTKANRPESGK